MTKEKNILFHSFCYLLLGFLICLIGISNVFASEIIIPGTLNFYDNNGSSLSSVTTDFENNIYYSTFTTQADSYGALVTFQLNNTIQKGRIYTIFILSGAESNGGQTRPSSKTSIGIGSNFSNANNSYINSTNSSSYSASSGTTSENSRGVYYTFIANETGSYISIPFTTQYTCSNCRQYFAGYSLEDLGNAENLSQEEVDTIINNQTSIIQNNITNLGDEISGTIKDEFNTCRDSYNLINPTFGGPYMNGLNVSKNSDGTINITGTPSQSWSNIAEDIQQNLSNGVYTFSLNKPLPFTIGLRYTDNNNNSVDFYIVNGSTSSTQTLPGNFTLYKIYIENLDTSINYNITNLGLQLQAGSASSKFEKPGEEVCQNKIDETNDKLDDTNNQLGNLNNNITNDNIDDNKVSNAFNQFEEFVDENATISSLLTLPVTLFTAILNGMQNSCSPFNLGSLYGEDLILPCIDISSYLGNTLWTMIDIIISGFAIYFISQKFIKVFNTFSSMKEGDVIDD